MKIIKYTYNSVFFLKSFTDSSNTSQSPGRKDVYGRIAAKNMSASNTCYNN